MRSRDIVLAEQLRAKIGREKQLFYCLIWLWLWPAPPCPPPFTSYKYSTQSSFASFTHCAYQLTENGYVVITTSWVKSAPGIVEVQEYNEFISGTTPVLSIEYPIQDVHIFRK